jgi:glycosyltransferase involved in cell wall biosynthesis
MEKAMSRVIKIAVDARPLSDPRGGIRRYTSNILREFASQGGPHRFFLYSDRPIHMEFPLPSHWSVRIGLLRRSGFSTLFAQLFFPVWARIDGIDVFWSPLHQLPLLLPARVRKVVTIHDLVWKRYPKTMKRGGRLVEAVLTPRSLSISDQVIAVSQFTRSELHTLIPDFTGKIDVIYEASSLEAREPPVSNPVSNPYFLYVGSSEPRKNMRRMLHAYSDYARHSSRPHDLVIVGADSWGDFSVTGFVQELGLNSQVHLFRDVDDDTLLTLYANARACIMVSLYEGFGLPLVEAMQCGVPMIVSRNSAMEEIAGDAAMLVDPYDENSIARALTLMTEDEGIHRGLAERVRVQGGRFCWKQAAAETMALLVGDLASTI